MHCSIVRCIHTLIYFMFLPVWFDSDGLAQNLGNSGADRRCRGLAQSLKPGLYSMRAYTLTVGEAVYTSVAGCAQRIRAHTPTVAVKVQTCWTFKASADQCRHSSQSRKRSRINEVRRVDLHRDVCGRIPTHTFACLYFYPRRNLRYAVATRRQPQAWISAPTAGAYARMEYKPGFSCMILCVERGCLILVCLSVLFIIQSDNSSSN